MAANILDSRLALASLSLHSVRDIRVRKCLETGRILLRFKVYGQFAPSVFDECRIKLVLAEVQIEGVIRVVQGEVVRSLVYFYEFQANDPLQINAVHFSEDPAQWSNVRGVIFALAGGACYGPNPFCRTD